VYHRLGKIANGNEGDTKNKTNIAKKRKIEDSKLINTLLGIAKFICNAKKVIFLKKDSVL